MAEGLNYIQSLTKWKGKGGFCLEPLRTVLSDLGNPQDCIKTIHVAGTNGKGSVSTFISSILGASGLKVGLNVSPHLMHLNERIVIDGVPVHNEFFDEYGSILKKVSERRQIELTFHEAITAISFLGFKEEGCDYAVMEVGLGGRLDASNVISSPEISIIVSIGLDHQDVLGEDISTIAREKAGILKKNCPAVCGKLLNEAQREIDSIVDLLKVPLYKCGHDYSFQLVKDYSATYLESTCGYELTFETSLLGNHQQHNAAVAIKAARILGLSDIDIKKGLKNAFWPGRLETVEYRDKKILIDCAHNPDGVEALTSYLKDHNIQDVIVGFGALDTKDWKSMASKLLHYVKEWHILEPDSERAVSCESVGDFLSCIGVSSKNYGTDYPRFINYINRLESNSLILLTGSIYLIGKLRSLLDIKERPLWTKN